MESILVIDDDVEMCGMLAEYLQSEGLQVETVHNGEDGLKRAVSAEHALILLDVMLPKINGIEVLRRLRTESNARVLLLTARGEEVDRIIGLEVARTIMFPSLLALVNSWLAFARFLDDLKQGQQQTHEAFRVWCSEMSKWIREPAL